MPIVCLKYKRKPWVVKYREPSGPPARIICGCLRTSMARARLIA